jgi:hypothetical protein
MHARTHASRLMRGERLSHACALLASVSRRKGSLQRSSRALLLRWPRCVGTAPKPAFRHRRGAPVRLDCQLLLFKPEVATHPAFLNFPAKKLMERSPSARARRRSPRSGSACACARASVPSCMWVRLCAHTSARAPSLTHTHACAHANTSFARTRTRTLTGVLFPRSREQHERGAGPRAAGEV